MPTLLPRRSASPGSGLNRRDPVAALMGPAIGRDGLPQVTRIGSAPVSPRSSRRLFPLRLDGSRQLVRDMIKILAASNVGWTGRPCPSAMPWRASRRQPSPPARRRHHRWPGHRGRGDRHSRYSSHATVTAIPVTVPSGHQLRSRPMRTSVPELGCFGALQASGRSRVVAVSRCGPMSWNASTTADLAELIDRVRLAFALAITREARPVLITTWQKVIVPVVGGAPSYGNP